jgi:hypothetical protein
MACSDDDLLIPTNIAPESLHKVNDFTEGEATTRQAFTIGGDGKS